jgi:flagellin
MALRVNTNVEAINVHNNLVSTSDKISTSLKRLSSGYRINSARDDAAGFAISNSFAAKVGSMKVASQNASEAQSMLQVADGAYSKVNDILVRMKNLATQAASGQTESLATMNNEFSSLQKEIDRIAGSTTYGTKNLTDGNSTMSTGGVTFQVGPTNATNNQINLKFSGAMGGCLGVSTSTISVNTAADAQKAMDAIDLALTSVNSYMGEIGAYQNRLQYTIENLAIGIENFAASQSTIKDVDMADEMTTFTKNQILQQSGMAMLSQANQAPQQILSLLK